MAEYSDYKTKDYIRRARYNYKAKFDSVSVNLPKGSKDKIKEATGMSINAYINDLVKEDMLAKYGISI